MENQSKIFYGISLVISYLIITEGNLFFAGWMFIAVPIFALWLSVPIFFSDTENLVGIIFGYIFWILIQWAIYYFGLGPPEGVGVPHF